MRPRSVVLVALLLGACGGSDDQGGGDRPDGASVANETGCLSCHRIGSEGNSGPGSDLSKVGRKLKTSEIRDALSDPPTDMPSYDYLPSEEFDALVSYLASLK